MSGFTGFYHYKGSYLNRHEHFCNLLIKMRDIQANRSTEDAGMLLTDACGLAHTSLRSLPPNTRPLPYTCKVGDKNFHIVYEGVIYNSKELMIQLIQNGYHFEEQSSAEVLLYGFLEYGTAFFKRLDGCFAASIYDEAACELYLIRDCFGCKPLFYTFVGKTLVFGSHLKSLLTHPDVSPSVGIDGLNELFSLGPARTPGKAVFDKIYEVKPAHFIICNQYGIKEERYWKLNPRPHKDSQEQTIEKTAALLTDAIKKQIPDFGNTGALLSGGIDSSIVSAVCADELRKQNRDFSTFSFEFEENENYFAANSFQPSIDRPYVDKMVEFLGSTHEVLECSQKELFDCLGPSVLAHDLPAMGDIDSSLLYFCEKVSKKADVVLTGECADEVFGGYPWFHRADFLEIQSFPWSMSNAPRKELLKKDFLKFLNMDDYIQNAYETTLMDIAYLPCEKENERNWRKNTYLSIHWFMQTLLNRMDCCSNVSGLEARVPFADRALVEYVYNIPSSIKLKDNVVKNLLRQSAKGLVPDEILSRKKSPYPKTYHPAFEKQVVEQIKLLINDNASPLHLFIDEDKLLSFANNPKEYGSPWYGQLMAGPQMLSYLIQIDIWIRQYNVKFKL